jgi:hypothetical protein
MKNALLVVPSGWNCSEYGPRSAHLSGTNSFVVGNIVADREYWVIFERSGQSVEEEDGPIVLSTPHLFPSYSHYREEITGGMVVDCQELQEQILRCRVAKAMVKASDCLESGLPIGNEIAALITEFGTLSDTMKARPLVVRMLAQLTDVSLIPGHRRQHDHMARMASGAATLSTQRGNGFASPLQRQTSQRAQSLYSDPVSDPI